MQGKRTAKVATGAQRDDRLTADCYELTAADFTAEFSKSESEQGAGSVGQGVKASALCSPCSELPALAV
jgi:hypothetical protein